MIFFILVMWLICSGYVAYVLWISALCELLQIYSHYVKPINDPELWKKTGKGIMLAPDFKKQRG